ncbi:MAG TPA: hypothetical protein PLT09_13875 [Deltaproteobacteria bacterium]|nr:hypothetical protein [Deltaproteobacteria bacterium]HPR54731.1 hypothetical protein [Deltaproteobacteria bacterium]HXK48530.1 hypothetical protein [Deltaproteobacteria bacterium]
MKESARSRPSLRGQWGHSFLGLKNEGLSKGASANFCVFDGDPFSDTSRVVQTWIDGKRVY